MPNRLADSTSPYLLQHQNNPVDWFEWGEEPFAIAADSDRPILLSVGYSACHWCHVMAHESFEDEETAAFLNANFVSIKVDREERPDIDRVYMDALQAMSGHGGWPMTVFLTPAGKPFFAGTYFPKERGHLPSFRQVLEAIRDAWEHKRDELTSQADQLTAAVAAGIPAGQPPATQAAVTAALETLQAGFDGEQGGFGGAPKFPQAPVLEMLMRTLVMRPSEESTIAPMLRRTLDAMRAGGIYDQIGGGFARYSVDRGWLIPHFEKMLYDNALLARTYLWAGVVFEEPKYTATAVETLSYLATEMRDPTGGIHAAEDADSEGVEGRYYVWSYDEFVAVTGDDAELLTELYGVTREGNFEGANNLHLTRSPADLAADRGIDEASVLAAKERGDSALRNARSQRVRPGRDDKVIAAWNGLALRSFAEAYAVLEDRTYLEVATGIAEFLRTGLTREDGRLMRSWRDGRTSVPGFLIDYAATATGLFSLYQVTGEERWFEEGRRLTLRLNELFAGPDGYFSTGSDQDDLMVRPREFQDNPLPAGNSLAAEAIATLEALTGENIPGLEAIERGAARLLERAPHAVPHLLSVLMTVNAGIKEVAIVGSAGPRRDLERVMWEQWRPDCVVALGDGTSSIVPLLTGRGTAADGAAAHVCRNFTCDLPVTTPDDLRRSLRT